MKKAIVYYSMGGNVEYVAQKISEKTGTELEAELILIDPKEKETEENSSMIDDFCSRLEE